MLFDNEKLIVVHFEYLEIQRRSRVACK